jgi:hypothetical protein
MFMDAVNNDNLIMLTATQHTNNLAFMRRSDFQFNLAIPGIVPSIFQPHVIVRAAHPAICHISVGLKY